MFPMYSRCDVFVYGLLIYSFALTPTCSVYLCIYIYIHICSKVCALWYTFRSVGRLVARSLYISLCMCLHVAIVPVFHLIRSISIIFFFFDTNTEHFTYILLDWYERWWNVVCKMCAIDVLCEHGHQICISISMFHMNLIFLSSCSLFTLVFLVF